MHENIVRIKAVSNILKGIGQPFVFVGGATVSLYATKSIAEGIRPTDDVDVVIEIATYADHSKFEDKLRFLGFVNDTESGVICRYKVQGIIVDIMPTNPAILGFSNRWYPEGFKHAIQYPIDIDSTVLIFSLPYFLASKWEAHKNRGTSDLRTSRDFEDMVYIFENCKNFEEELLKAPSNVRDFLIEELKPLLDDPDFEEALYCHMDGVRYGASPQELIDKVKIGLSLN